MTSSQPSLEIARLFKILLDYSDLDALAIGELLRLTLNELTAVCNIPVIPRILCPDQFLDEDTEVVIVLCTKHLLHSKHVLAHFDTAACLDDISLLAIFADEHFHFNQRDEIMIELVKATCDAPASMF